MKVTTFAKASVSVAAAAALTCGLAATAFASSTTPTATEEDAVFPQPNATTTLVGVGSDTTQDVMYGIAKAINTAEGKQVIASYTATGTGSLTYRSGLTPATRPNGSGAGYNALKDSIGVTAAGLANAGDVDFARASGKQGTAAATAGAGVSTDIPFAVDAMSVAVPANSPFLLTNAGAGLSITDLYNIYAGVDTYIDTTDGSLETAAGANMVPIHAFVPKPGSGSRQFFLGQLATQGSGIQLGTNKGDSLYTSNQYAAAAPFIGAVDSANAPVQEHDATVLTAEPSTVAAIAPFSAAKFIGYHNASIADPDAGKVAGTDYKLVPFKSSVTGAPSTGVLPYTGTTTLSPNSDFKTYAKQGGAETAFALTRDVYNIIPTAAVKGGGTSSNAQYNALYSMFVGASSKVCQQSTVIAQFGFLPASNCGNTDLTFDAPSTATATVTAGSGVAGKSAPFTVSVQSNGNGGGTATITVGENSYTGTIAKGATSVTINVPTPTPGSFTYSGSFTPALAGVAAAPIAEGSFTVAKAPVVLPVKVNAKVSAKAPKAKHTKKAKVTVMVSASGTVPTGKVTLVVKKGAKTQVTVKNKTLANGKVVITLTKKLKKGSYKVFVSYAGDAKTNAVKLTSVAKLKVS